MDHVSWDVPTDLANAPAFAQDPAFRSAYAPHGMPTNLLDNGAMNVCQRATSLAGITSASGLPRTVDRWHCDNNGLGTVTDSQTVDAPAGTEFTNCHKTLITTADAAPAAGDYFLHAQAMEGQMLQHLLWGTVNAKSVTVSFWVKANITATFIIELFQIGSSRTIAATYTVNVANTWEYKTLTFPGDTVQAITNDSAARFIIQWWFGASSTYAGGAALQTFWGVAAANTRAVGCTNLAATINNFVEITGAQLEVGTLATPFQSRAYDDELIRCMRYYEPTGFILNTSASPPYWSGYWKVVKRAVPTLTLTAQVGAGGHVAPFTASFGPLHGFYQDATHSAGSNSLVEGSCEI